MSTGQALGGVVGAAAGFFLSGGTPMGAVYGAQIGMMAGGYLDPPKGPTMAGPRLSDLSVQTSTYGAFIPRVYGTVALNGNVFWLENNKLKEVAKKQKSGGKGGGIETTTKTYTYFATFSVGICEGPIDGVRRIWAGNTLIYDSGSTTILGVIASKKRGQNFTIYKGDDTQLPDSRMQAEMGAANCPAYRGLAYIVFKDFALEKYGNSLQGCPIKVEVVKDATYSNIAQVGSFISGPEAQGSKFANVPYADHNGAYLWSCTDEYASSNITTITQSLISNDGTVVPLRAARITAYDSAYLLRIPRGHGDINHFALSSRQGGPETEPTLTIYREDFSSTRYKTGNPSTTSCERYLIHDGKLYIAGTLYTPNIPQLFVQPLSPTYTVAAQQIIFPFNGSACADTALGVVGGVLLVSAYNSDTYQERLHAFDLSDYSYLGSTTANYASASVDFFDDVMYYKDAVYPGHLYKRETWNGPDILIGTIGTNLAPASSYASKRLFMRHGTIFQFLADGEYTSSQQSAFYTVDVLSSDEIPASYIMSEECKLSGLLSPADVDFSALTDTVRGIKVSNISAIRSVVEILRSVHPFDVIQDGYQIKGIKRGGSSVAAITIGDLGQDQQLQQVREMDSQLPVEIVASYLDSGRDYDVNQQVWSRPSTGTVNSVRLELPVVLAASQAAQIVEVLGSSYWNERVDFGPFTLPPTFNNLQPSDVVTLDAGYAIYELRLTSINYKSDGSLECMAKANSAVTYVSMAESEETPGDLEIEMAGGSYFVPMDIPVVDETLQNSAGFVGAMCGYAPGWSSGVLVRSLDDGQTWVEIQGFTGEATIGITFDALTASSGALIDLRALNVLVVHGEFYSVTRDQMLSGANYAAYGKDGRWEIVRFQEADLQSDGSYNISSLVRGDRGTEWATGLHEPGDYFIPLDDLDLVFMGSPVETVGTEFDYRAVTSGDSVDSAFDQPFAYRAVNLECLSPVYPYGVRDGSGNFSGSFTRRSRLSSNWWTSGVVAPVGEVSESYVVDVMDGAAIKRSFAVSSPAFSYSAADQTTDFGAAQATIAFRIFQISGQVGRGYPLEVTL